MADKAAEKEINKIRRLPENKVCPNCGKEAQNWGFTAVVVPFSIFVCDDCKSAHQSFSHRCKSATMSNWTMDEVRKLMEQNGGGNKACIAKWFVNLEPGDRRKPQPDTHIDKKKDFVNMAYNQKLWLGSGSDSRRGDRGRDDSPNPPPRRRGDRGRDDSPDPPPRRRGDRGRDNDPPARMAPPNGGLQAAAPSVDLFDMDAPSTGSARAPGGGFDPSGGFNPTGSSSGSLFDPNPPAAASGGGFNPNAGSSSGALFDPNPPAVSGGGGGFNPNAGSTSFDLFTSGAPASQPSLTGGFSPNTGAQQAAAPPAISAGGFDDFGFDSFQAAPAAPVGQTAGSGFNPNGPAPAQGGGFDPSAGFNPSAPAPAGGVGGCGSPAGANTAAALWGNAGGAGGMPCMGGCGCVGAMPAAGGDRFAALGGGYSQMQMQQQAPWPQQQPAAFGAPPAAMGQQPNNRFAALGAPSGPQMMAAAGFQQQQMRGPAGCGGCGGQALGMQPGGMPGAPQQGGFNPSTPTMGAGNVQDLQRSLNNLYDGSGGQQGKGPAGGGQAQGAFGAFSTF